MGIGVSLQCDCLLSRIIIQKYNCGVHSYLYFRTSGAAFPPNVVWIRRWTHVSIRASYNGRNASRDESVFSSCDINIYSNDFRKICSYWILCSVRFSVNQLLYFFDDKIKLESNECRKKKDWRWRRLSEVNNKLNYLKILKF